ASALAILDQAPGPQKQLPALLRKRNWALLLEGNRRAVDEIAQSGSLPEVDLQRGLLELQAKNYAGARKTAEELLAKHPQNVQAGTLLAESYAAGNQIPAGVERLRELTQVNPRSAQLLDLLGRWQLRAKDQDGARQSFEAARTIDPQFTPPTLEL